MNQANHSSHIKQTALEKMQGPSRKSVAEVSEEMGINKGTLYGWLKKSENGNMRKKMRRLKMGFQEKYRIILEFRALADSDQGKWLRENGYKEEQIKLWEKEIQTALGKIESGDTKGIEKELRDTKKDLARKEKALAEVSALLVLKKKLDLLLSEDSGK